MVETKICANGNPLQAPTGRWGVGKTLPVLRSRIAKDGNTQHPMEAHEQGPVDVPKQEIHISVFRLKIRAHPAFVSLRRGKPCPFVVKFFTQMNSQSSNLISKYAPAVFVAFVTSVVSYLVLVFLGIRCDFGDIGALGGFGIHFLTLVIVGFVGVFFGTLCLPGAERGIASKHLLVIGLVFSLLPSSLMLFLPVLPLALGGYLAVLIFKKLGREPSDAARGRRLAIVLSVVICMMISIVVLLVRAGGPMTNEKAAKLFERAGGLAKVEQEANVLFERYGTNGGYLPRSDRTNFPALSALGASISFAGESKIVIRHGPLTNSKFIYIFRSAPDTNQATTSDNSKFFTAIP